MLRLLSFSALAAMTFGLSSSVAFLSPSTALVLATNFPTVETIVVQGYGPDGAVQSLYDSLNGTFALPEDLFGPGAHISGLTFSNSSDSMDFLDQFNINVTSLAAAANTSSSLGKRATYTEKVKTVECMDSPRVRSPLVVLQFADFHLQSLLRFDGGENRGHLERRRYDRQQFGMRRQPAISLHGVLDCCGR
ncbi:hypothetical protein N7488_008813 [Penicillium malachiteum]|nr:hypothetical protein N7488_008813 [Penicillium malachiteum]